MVCANYCIPYPKQPCVVHEVNIWYSCYMTLFVLDPFTPFSAFHDLTLALYSKNRKIKQKQKPNKIKNKE